MLPSHLTMGGKRDDWVFTFTCQELLDGAKAKKAFHEGRLKSWVQTKSDIVAKIKTGGVTVNESILVEAYQTGQFSNKQGASAPSVQVDAKLQKDLADAHKKVQQHEEKVLEFDAWVQALTKEVSRGVNTSRDLLLADWLFFFGK